MEFATFPMLNRPQPKTPAVGIDHLEDLLRRDAGVADRTAKARASSMRKGFLPAVALSGQFRRLPPTAWHGRAKGHQPTYCAGYRNLQHFDWNAHTGGVLLDLDGVSDLGGFQTVSEALRTGRIHLLGVRWREGPEGWRANQPDATATRRSA